MSSVRAPAVAGVFYPGEAAALRDAVDRLLGEMPLPRFAADRPRALIAPHAGYAYSGPVAASAFGRTAPLSRSRTNWFGRSRPCGFAS